MTTADQYQKQGAYRNYRQINEYPISVGTDATNDNASGSLCFIPYYKRGTIVPGATNVEQRTILLPPYSQAVNMKIENRTIVPITNTLWSLSTQVGAGTKTLISVSNVSIPAKTAIALNVSSPGRPDYGPPSAGLLNLTKAIFTILGIPASILFEPFYYTIGFINAKEYNVSGQ